MKFIEKIEGADTIAIGGHVRPDGDCVGSCMGLFGYLADHYPEKKVCVYLEEIPEAFDYLKIDEAMSEKADKYDLFIALDCGSIDRLGEAQEIFEKAVYTVCVDHHISNTNFAKENIVKANASSTCEILCELLPMDKIGTFSAIAFYTGIIHDTGVFKHSNTSKKTMETAGYLVEKRDGALEDGNRLNRYAYGEGERQQEVWVRGLCEKEIPVEISLGEREYAEEDAKKALLEAGGKLADLIRGNNLSLQEVREDLHLVGWLEEEGIRVCWTPEDAEWIQTDGTVLNEECPEKGIQTELTASLQAGVFSREYRFPVTLYPPLQTKQQEKEAGFKRLLKQMDEAQRTEGQLVLPKMYEGKNLSYRVRGDREYLLFPVLGIVAAILLPLYEKQKESEAKKKKKRELMEDYPEIVSKLTVFSGAGLPVRRAWERIVLEYEAACRAGTQTERAAYREMAAAYHRMQRGVSELQAYAEFGAGCRLRPYRKLSGLLEQNVRNGAEGLRKALETEMESAFEEEKALARRRGEEASTKLMLPLFLMLMIIMVMVSVPAFLAFGI